MQPNTPFPTRRLAEAWRQANPTPSPAQLRAFTAAQPLLLPYVATISRRLLRTVLGLLLGMAVVAVLAIWFFLFGEKRPARVRPTLTPAQRANAFRI